MRKIRKMSEETKKKISDSMRGRKRSEEERKNISNGMKKYWANIPYE